MRTVVLSPQWYKAECDRVYDLNEDGERKKDGDGNEIILKESTVEFQLKPLTNQMASDIVGNVPYKKRGKEFDADGGYISTMQVRVSLVGIKGLKATATAPPEDPENEELMKDLELAFIKEKIGIKKVEILSITSMNLLPPDLYAEILLTIKGNMDDDVDEEAEVEQEEMDFTPDSSVQTGSSVET